MILELSIAFPTLVIIPAFETFTLDTKVVLVAGTRAISMIINSL